MNTTEATFDGFRLSPEQHRLWSLHRDAHAAMFQTECTLDICGSIPPEEIRNALLGIIQQHEILRTTFHKLRGLTYPAQVISEKSSIDWHLLDLRTQSPEDRVAGIEQALTRNVAFTLNVGPLLHATYIALADDRAQLHLRMPALCTDSVSMLNLLRLLAAELGIAEPGSEPASDEPLQYADLAEWRNGLLEGDERAQSNCLQIPANVEPIGLPYEAMSPEGALCFSRISRTLPNKLTQKLMQLTQSQAIMPDAFLCSCWQVLLWRLSGHTDTVLGIGCDGRTYEELAEPLGLFAKYLPLLSQLDGAQRFSGVLNQTAQQIQQAAENQEYYDWPLPPAFETDGSRFLPYVFEFQELPNPIRNSELSIGLSVGPDHVAPPVNSRLDRFKARLSCQSAAGSLLATLEYDRRLFKAEVMDRMLKQFIAVATSALDNLDQSLGKLSLLDDEQAGQILNDFRESAPAVPCPNKQIHELIKEQCIRSPASIAASCGNQQLTYAQLDEAAEKLVPLLQDLGVGPNVLVPLLCERSTNMLIGLYAILKAGGAYVPIDVSTPPQRLSLILEDVSAKVLITQTSLAKTLHPHGAQVVLLDDDNEFNQTEQVARHQPGTTDDLAYLIYTSGSTGRPKGVPIRHRNLVYSTMTRMAHYPSPVRRYLLSSSLSFDSSVAGLFWTLLQGGTLVIPREGEERDPGRMSELVASHAVTHMLCLPSMYQMMLQQSSGHVMTSLQTVIVAGEVCSTELVARHNDLLPRTTLYNEYGPTEATVWSTVYNCSETTAQHTIPIGRPIPGARIYILDTFMSPSPIGVPGELYIGGPGLADEYHLQPDLSSQRFVDDPFSQSSSSRLYKTGDLATFLPEGTIQFLGRTDDQVKLRGYRIEPGEIIHVLEQQASIEQAIVLPRGDSADSRQLVAYLLISPGASLDAVELRETLKETLPSYMIPAHFVELSKFPLTVNGKIDRHALPDPDSGRPHLSQEYVAPRTTLEKQIASTWSALLKVSEIGVHDDFFELGGNSIQAAIFINKLQEQIGEYIHVATMFRIPTIAGFASYVETHYPNATGTQNGKDKATQDAFTERPIVDEQAVSEVRKAVIPLGPPVESTGAKAPRAVFVLCSPRSGSTLLRVMLAGNPRLFVPPELELLNFNGMRERDCAFSGADQFLGEGLIRAVMQVRDCRSDEASRIVSQMVESDKSTKDMYMVLQEAIGDRVLVDKTACYSLDLDILQHAEAYFEDPLYVHIIRHPCGMIHSFNQMHLDQVFFRYPNSFSTRELAELVWIICQQNIAQFLSDIPKSRQIQLKYEHLVRDPEKVMLDTCKFLQIPFSAAMLDPYKPTDWKMLDGTSAHSKMQGDPRFHEHSRVDAEIAERWKAEFDMSSVGDITRQLAFDLGYDIPDQTHVFE